MLIREANRPEFIHQRINVLPAQAVERHDLFLPVRQRGDERERPSDLVQLYLPHLGDHRLRRL